MSKATCGQHAELVSNNVVRVTRCPCGMVHVTLNASGVTVRMPSEAFRTVSAALRAAEDKLGRSTEITATGSTSIN